MKLIGSDASPFARKVRVVLAEKKIDCPWVVEDVWSATSTLMQINPLGQVPTLVTDDGSVIIDSRVIVEYLDTLTPLQRLIPPSGRERVLVKCWEALADGLLDAAVLIRLETTQRSPEQRSASWVARQRSKIDATLTAMNNALGEQAFFCDGKYSLADIAVGCALGYLDLRFPDIDWRAQHPNLERLATKLFTKNSFIDTRPPTPPVTP
jgi:glutathione S-transferase